MGGFEPVAKPWGMEGIPATSPSRCSPRTRDHFQVLIEQALAADPALGAAPVRRHVNGPESFTPDGRYLLGEAPECRNFYVGAGFNSIGIASAAGAGKVLAESIVGWRAAHGPVGRRHPPRGALQANPRYLRDRTVEMVGVLYAMHWPFRQPETARGRARCRCSTTAWRARRLLRRRHGLGAPQLVRLARHRAGVSLQLRPADWFALRGEEHRAVRERGGPASTSRRSRSSASVPTRRRSSSSSAPTTSTSRPAGSSTPRC